MRYAMSVRNVYFFSLQHAQYSKKHITIKVKRGSNVQHVLLQPPTWTVSVITSNGYMVRGRKHVSVRSVGTSPTPGVALRGIKNHA